MLQSITVTAEQERMLREQDWGLLTEDERAQMYRRADSGPLEVRITEGRVEPRTNYTPFIVGAIGLIAVMMLFGGKH